MSTKLLTNLNFAELISKTEAITEAGKEMLSRYKGYCYSNPVSCSIVNSFIAEASKYGFDTGLTNILESVNSFIKENIFHGNLHLHVKVFLQTILHIIILIRRLEYHKLKSFLKWMKLM